MNIVYNQVIVYVCADKNLQLEIELLVRHPEILWIYGFNSNNQTAIKIYACCPTLSPSTQRPATLRILLGD